MFKKPKQKESFEVKEDPESGLCSFPDPEGAGVYPQIPLYIDPEDDEEGVWKTTEEGEEDRSSKLMKDSLWMPDKICKVCYNCEDPFTMYRRRHHCRMCGQIFCDRCSNHYIDGSQVPGLGPGPHRSCQMCHDLARNKVYIDKDAKQYRRQSADWNSDRGRTRSYASEGSQSTTDPITGRQESVSRSIGVKDAGRRSSFDRPPSHALRNGPFVGMGETDGVEEIRRLGEASATIQHRAACHLEAIANRLVDLSGLPNAEQWKEAVVSLTNEVVASVDPDVRNGDSMDIRTYVKLKVIPGGNMDECMYVDGIVFRKNVSHKKMIDKASGGVKYNPKILILGGGIEFHRNDNKLSNMDTLIDQEEKYISILVEKIMTLRPDLIIVGKAVSRQAQELLCEHNVAVVQHVKADLLEQIGRITGAIVLPSSDHMIHQYVSLLSYPILSYPTLLLLAFTTTSPCFATISLSLSLAIIRILTTSLPSLLFSSCSLLYPCHPLLLHYW